MIYDPIVEEIQKYRKEHAAKYGNDLHSIVDAFREKERLSNRPLVNFGPKLLLTPKRAAHVVEESGKYLAEN